jgi:hypothetical protein
MQAPAAVVEGEAAVRGSASEVSVDDGHRGRLLSLTIRRAGGRAQHRQGPPPSKVFPDERIAVVFERNRGKGKPAVTLLSLPVRHEGEGRDRVAPASARDDRH